MKKRTWFMGALLASVAPTAHADELLLNLGGYYDAYGVYMKQSEGVGRPGFQRSKVSVEPIAEVRFQGEKTLENGLTIGTFVTLWGQNEDTGEDIDESYVYFSGNWGKAIVGETYSATYQMKVAAPSVDVNIDGFDPYYDFINYNAGVTNVQVDTAPNLTDRNEKLVYFTPEIAGFQAGVSYSPDNCRPGGTGCTGRLDGMPSNKTVGDLQDIWDGGLTWGGDVGDVALKAGASVTHGTLEANDATNSLDDRTQVSLGGTVGYDDFTFGADWLHDNKGDTAKKDWVYQAYRLGASWHVSEPVTVAASWLHNAQEVGAGIKKEELNRFALGGSYEFGPGLTFTGEILRYDFTAANPADKNRATGIVLGSKVEF